MPDTRITAGVSVGDGVATAQIHLPDQREHMETVPLHPRYPEGAPEEFMALDSMRAALASVEKETFPSLYDLIQTQEAAQRAKELGLHEETQTVCTRYVRPSDFVGGRRGGGGRSVTGAIQAAMRGDWDAVRGSVRDSASGEPNEPTTAYRREELQELPVVTASRELPTVTADDIMQAARAVLDGPSSIEPAPIVAVGRIANGRHIITPGGTYQVVMLRSSFLVDPTRTPEGPSDEWIRAELARRIANELAGHISVSRVVRATDRFLTDAREYRAELTLLERRD